MRASKSGPARALAGLVSSFFAVLLVASLSRLASAEVLPETVPALQSAYGKWRAKHMERPAEANAAWRFAEACFDLAEYATNAPHRASLAAEGINAARAAIQSDEKCAAGYFYLALNMGQLARTKTLGALGLVRQMEKALLRAIELDAHFNHAGPDRSLGMLYLDAPGWPASIGNRRKAREHLERAVELEPDYPDNHLSLLEAYVRWHDKDALAAGIQRYSEMLGQAKGKYSGNEWQQSWQDWEARWRSILEQSKS